MDHPIEIQIASVTDREKLVAELWFRGSQVAELNSENGILTVQIYPNPSGGHWDIEFEDFFPGSRGRARSGLNFRIPPIVGDRFHPECSRLRSAEAR